MSRRAGVNNGKIANRTSVYGSMGGLAPTVGRHQFVLTAHKKGRTCCLKKFSFAFLQKQHRNPQSAGGVGRMFK